MKILDKNKRLRNVLIAVVVFGLVTLSVVIVYSLLNKQKKSDSPNINTKSTELVAKAPEKSDIEYARTHQTAIGTISNISTTQIVVKTKDNQSQTFKITSSTTYSVGRDYLDGKRSDVKVGQSVSVTYNPDNQEVWTIWYAF